MSTCNRSDHKKTVVAMGIALMFVHGPGAVQAASTDIANVPMAVSNMVTPNVLVVYDNSQSMDAYMSGTLVSGNDPSTRSNIGRSVMRNAIGTYRNAFNWGLMTYEMSAAAALYKTYAYFLGDGNGMTFTDDCIDPATGSAPVSANPPKLARSASHGNRRCIANPQPFTGGNFVTYDKTGDDADIQDVLYTTGVYTGMWGLSSSGTNYHVYKTHDSAWGNSWSSGAFGGYLGHWNFSFTDAGYLPSAPTTTRQVWLPRGWGYNTNITGAGALVEKVDVDSTTHYNNLLAQLANETDSATGEIKNGAVYTPLRGSLQSAKSYYSGNLGRYSSPTRYACQQNFVMMVTDGLPTGDTSGNLYSEADRTNSCNWSTVTHSCTSGSFGTAATDAIAAVSALRTTAVSNAAVSSTSKDGSGTVTGKFDVQTYVVALGDTVANANALSVMNAMAYNGGTEKAIAASDATAFANAISSISDDITAKVGSSAAVAVANAHVTSSDNASYASIYNSGTWTGDLNAYAIDVATGIPSTTPSWTSSAAVQLDLRTSADRYIVSSPDAAGAIGGIQFQPVSASTTTKLSAAQQTLLNTPSTTDGDKVLEYLRGDRTGETAGTYRARAHLLGDMVNAEPLLVRAPSSKFGDAGYSAFKTANAGRTRVLFQGANDGMLHAFEASTGRELWAYVPNLVMSKLNNLSLRPGFTHKYTVDGTPVASDVDFKNVDGAGGSGTDWRTIVVGALGKGGNGYYALDVTTPTATSEADAAAKVLWEFPNSISNTADRNAAKKNMGYSFGKPTIVKTTAKGWVVLVTSGYNNGTNPGDSGGDGLGHLYVINPKTGDLIKDIVTPAGTATPATDPFGLAQISAYSASNIDLTTDYVYGGDLKGNLWRFNLTGNNTNGWGVSLFALLKDGSRATQPITSAPELATLDNVRMVFVGTGQYLGVSDVSNTQTQTMYGLKDTLAALLPASRANLQEQTLTTSGNYRTLSNNTVAPTARGWYIDLPSSGERSHTDPMIALSTLIFTTNIPSATPCSPGGSSWIYFVNLKTGGKIDNSTSPASGQYLANALASRAVVIQLPNGKIKAIIRISQSASTGGGSGGAGGGAGPGPGDCVKSGNNVICPPTPQPASTGPKRISWREIFK